MRRKFTLIICIVLLLQQGLTAFAQGRWSLISTPAQTALRKIFFTDSLCGWAAGENGTILHSADGGLTWVPQASGTEEEISDIFFLNRNQGWAVCVSYSASLPGTQLLATSDGGKDWIPLGPPLDHLFIRSVLFLDPLHGWLGGAPHALLRTSDGGNTWQEANIVPSPLSGYPVLKIRFLDSANGYACGGIHDVAGVIWRTTDGGDSWTAIDPVFAPADEVFDLHILDAGRVIGVGGDPDFEFGVGMMFSGDSPMDFVYKQYGFRGYAIDLEFRTSTEAWSSLGRERKLIYSLDAGSTWSEIPSPDSVFVTSMAFPDPSHGFACGACGEILKYSPLALGVAETGGTAQEDGPGIAGIYPVPVRGFVTIKVHIPRGLPGTPLQIKIYDITGQEVASQVNGPLAPGDHTVTFDASALHNGLYYCRLSGSPSRDAAQRFIVEH